MLNESLPAGWSAPVNIGDGSTSSSKFFSQDGQYRTVSAAPGVALAPLCSAVDAEYAARDAKKAQDATLKAAIDAAYARVAGGGSDGADMHLLAESGNVDVNELQRQAKRVNLGAPRDGVSPKVRVLP